jgi:hypothetical protein
MTEETEKRKARRIVYPCEVEFIGSGRGRVSGRITVLSVRGAFIETAAIEPVGARLTLRFPLANEPMMLTAEVADTQATGIGVHFLAMTRAQRTVFDKVLGPATTP